MPQIQCAHPLFATPARVGRARVLLDAYAAMPGTLPEQADQLTEDLDTQALRSLLTDLLHFTARSGISFRQVIDQAAYLYEVERLDHATPAGSPC